MAYQLAGIDVRYRNNVLLLKIILYRFGSLFTAVSDIVIFTNQAGNLDMVRLYFVNLYTIITDVRIGGYHDLPEVRRVGKYFLVSCHTGIKAYLAGGGADLSGGFAIKHGAVGQ